jgi:DnaJ-class molecular chaperone
MRIEVVHGVQDVEPDQPCPRCHGLGIITGQVPCPACHGSGMWVWTNAYTYECPWPVVVGAIVLVPGNAANPDVQKATVTRLGSAYLDPVETVIGVLDQRIATDNPS